MEDKNETKDDQRPAGGGDGVHVGGSYGTCEGACHGGGEHDPDGAGRSRRRNAGAGGT